MGSTTFRPFKDKEAALLPPVELYAARGPYQCAVFRRIGGELVQNQSDRLRTTRVQQEARPLRYHGAGIQVAIRVELLVNQATQIGTFPAAF